MPGFFVHVLQRKSYFVEGAPSLLRLPKELLRRHGSNAGAPSASRELPQRRRSSFVQKVGNEGAPSTNVIFSEIIVSCDSNRASWVVDSASRRLRYSGRGKR